MSLAESCNLNFTEPEGNIEILQKVDSGVECNFLVTVYLGYGIEVQVSARNSPCGLYRRIKAAIFIFFHH